MKGCDEVPMFIYKEVLMSTYDETSMLASMNLKHHLHTKDDIGNEGVA